MQQSIQCVAEYTHPGNPNTVMRAYRKFVLARKLQWMAHSGGKPVQRRMAVRAHMKYRDYIEQYLAAKKRLITGV